MGLQSYEGPALRAYGSVEELTGTFDHCFDLNEDGQGKQLALSVDWRGKFPIPLTEECTVETFSA